VTLYRYSETSQWHMKCGWGHFLVYLTRRTQLFTRASHTVFSGLADVIVVTKKLFRESLGQSWGRLKKFLQRTARNRNDVVIFCFVPQINLFAVLHPECSFFDWSMSCCWAADLHKPATSQYLMSANLLTCVTSTHYVSRSYSLADRH
jgi:hypothetical protein